MKGLQVVFYFIICYTYNMIKWEYKIEKNIEEDKLNYLGSDGWELINIGGFREMMYMGTREVKAEGTFYFKRKKKE